MEQTYSDGIFREMTSAEYAEFSALQERALRAPKQFLPIEPVPFWRAAWDLLSLKKADIYAAIEDQDERYLAELDVEGRKSYRRDDPMVMRLSQLLNFPAEQMDTLWVYVQDHYE
ncbi:hypothetical protein M2418_002293 [Rhizobium sp. BIGb0125]|jgi:hypothetical protein|uniref:hypothetical protein n=1 Tax=Rhizobium sp. BIGb0125 TaxID=2940618 RepID=UPI002168BE25|nr:hypothetical protein [Rhizobium sp. BIGb0125]MCS4242767.1 hypothetical protein [Rhizobium sp. BIGb0125]